MDIPVKTLQSGFSLPEYGLGTWEMGGRWEADRTNDESELAAITAAIDHGITHIDTAEGYGNGHAEELVGQAIRNYDRDRLFIASKVSAQNQAYDNVLKACESSLRRLNTNYLDLYMPHRFPEPGMDIKNTMRALDRLVDEGLVKHIGFCNVTINRFEAAQRCSRHKLVCNQLEYSLQVREATMRGIIKHAQANDYFVVAWGPLQKGAMEHNSLLREIADKYGKTPYQVALNWLIAQPNVVTIPKTTQLAHLEENLGSLGWNLSAEDVARLTVEFPNQLTTSQRVPLDYEASVPAE